MKLSTPDRRPLTPGELYLLLALSSGAGHAYNLRNRIWSLSQGAVEVSSGAFTGLRVRLQEIGYIELLEIRPAGKSGTPRRHYGISEHGLIRLKEELVRLRHAVKIAENAGLFDDETPLDIQKLILDAR